MERPDENEYLIDKRKMYVIVRGDLPPGLRAAQAGHAIAEICLRQNRAASWNLDPLGNYLIILEVPDEGALLEAFQLVKSYNICREMFREPDLRSEATALACLPPPELNHVLSGFPLAYTKRRWSARLRRRAGSLAP